MINKDIFWNYDSNDLETENEEELATHVYDFTWQGIDFTINELCTMIKEGDLIIPNFQRKLVWDKFRKSKFIESLLMGFPIPNIFFSETEKNKYWIVDGLQRITTAKDYINGKFALSSKETINEKWRNLSFSNLSEEEKRRIKRTLIRTIIIKQVIPKNSNDSIFGLFERINTGSVPLNSQEIRNAIYAGPFNDLLNEIAETEIWKKMYKGKDIVDIRMLDAEVILRYFGLKNIVINSPPGLPPKINLKEVLNECMKNYKNIDPNNKKIFKEEFIDLLELIYNFLGAKAFYRYEKKEKMLIPKSFNTSVFDSFMYGFYSFYKKYDFKNNFNEIDKNKFIDIIFLDSDYQRCVQEKTMDLVNIKYRYETVKKALQKIIDEK
ncbi:DUF262 domain-containing protein [Spiroplasma chrysopicola]|uniref:GmrSD restriction endonucleases N-terminal domain-containing protein n=1 Tax=Spiroplasma chrysopicola DF-1 TaxID=1276227 RepID=R4U2X8_9MOLU|nr:DUF262 domain-containing protein [Spiroplasma chrysopicola]AGM24843.1 hypothetical protein SCHRY_v1c02580 [Spiroplasma chrysopicola DF-1]